MTINWTGPNQRILRQAMLEVYRDRALLKIFVRDHISDASFLNSVSGESKDVWAASLLEQADARGLIDDLYATFCEVNLENPYVIQLRRDLNDPSDPIEDALLTSVSPGRQVGTPYLGDTVSKSERDSELHEDPNSAHLVLAVFWQERKNLKFRVQPKLHFQAMKTDATLPDELSGKEKYSVPEKDFPAFLTRLVKFTIGKLSQFRLDLENPWRLSIELFVPVDLLCQPISTWCGQDGDLLSNRPIVIGCSDRFDPDRPEDALDLLNHLEHGWQRFRAKVPDRASAQLKHLEWLNSDDACHKSLRDYSGFQCYGDWLKSEKEALKNWQELVKSGIPLALWMCEGKPKRSDVISLFNRLIGCNRFEFLHQLPSIRDEQQKTCNHCIGVLYEDLNYLPEKPQVKEEQIFSWPGA